MAETPHHQSSYLLQRHVTIDGGAGAWISLKMFANREEAEKRLAELKLGESGRVIEAVCEPTA